MRVEVGHLANKPDRELRVNFGQIIVVASFAWIGAIPYDYFVRSGRVGNIILEIQVGEDTRLIDQNLLRCITRKPEE